MADKQLTDYISQSLAAGISKKETTKILLGVGWAQTDITAALTEVQQTQTEIKPEEAQAKNADKGFYGDGGLVQLADLGIPGGVKLPDKSDKQIQSDAVIRPAQQWDKPGGLGMSSDQKPIDGNQKPEVQTKHSPVKIFLSVGLAFTLIAGTIFAVWWLTGGNAVLSVKPETNISDEIVVPQPPEEPAIISIAVLEDKEYASRKGFAITSPKSWVTDESGIFGTLVNFTAPVADEESGSKFSANINVVTEGSQNTDLDQYIAISRKSLEETFTAYKRINEKELTIDGKEAVWVEAEYETSVYLLRNMQLIVKTDNSFYVITGTALASRWGEYREVIEKSLMTFRENVNSEVKD